MKIFTWRQRVYVLAVNAVSLALFLLVGAWLDRQFSTRPLFFILGLITSFIIGQFVLTKILIRDYRSTSKSE